jgi:hypothetical protein
MAIGVALGVVVVRFGLGLALAGFGPGRVSSWFGTRSKHS